MWTLGVAFRLFPSPLDGEAPALRALFEARRAGSPLDCWSAVGMLEQATVGGPLGQWGGLPRKPGLGDPAAGRSARVGGCHCVWE